MSNDVTKRLAALREVMQAQDVAACLIPGDDPHMSEYLPEHWQARVHFSGFTGSAGTLLVAREFAGLWTDSRYFEQAGKQLEGSGVTLMRQGWPDTPEPVEWLATHLESGETTVADGACLSVALERDLRKALEPAGASLRIDLDLPGEVWDNRPALPDAPVTEHPMDYAITTRADKLARVRKAMAEAGATHHLVSSLADVAWILNLRGGDVDYNPIFLSHLLVEPERCTLFVDASKFDDSLRDKLEAEGIAFADYRGVTAALTKLPGDARVMYSPAHVASAIVDALPDGVERLEQPNPSTLMKAIKTPEALEFVRTAMREDGAALVRGFHRIERGVTGGDTVTELDVATILREERAARPDFVSESFNTIAGYMANGAMPHYAATLEQHSTIKSEGLLLVDSGAQYLGGTTDITRVWAFGPTSEEQRRDFTMVMKGMIALSRARFPEGASGEQIDAIAHAPLWSVGADYGHGTGHGVGYFLNVHEGPQRVAPPRTTSPLVPLQPGMISSIEPGLYKPGRHGVRHENLAVVRESVETEFGKFREFETLTVCPFDTRVLEPSLLDEGEKSWLNAYHARVEKELAPLIKDDADRAWLHERCAPVA